MHHQREHLTELAHRGFAAVVLPVGIGHEADRGVETPEADSPTEVMRIARQQVCTRKTDSSAALDDGQGHRGADEGDPALLTVRVDAQQSETSRSTGRKHPIAGAFSLGTPWRGNRPKSGC